MERKFKSFKIFLFLFISIIISINFMIGNVNSAESLSVDLISNKLEYNLKENIELFLIINNSFNEEISAEIKGKVLIGDTGYDIECFDVIIPKKQVISMGLTPLPASFSGSNMKTLSTLYACSGRQLRSSKTFIDNSVKNNKNGEEIFNIDSFSLTYKSSKNTSKLEAISNSLSIKIKSEEKEEKEEGEEEGEEVEGEKEGSEGEKQEGEGEDESGNNEKNTQNQEDKQGKQLSNEQQQALSKNQENTKSINELKKQIENAKNELLNKNESNEEGKNEEKSKSLRNVFILLILLLMGFLTYMKYFYKKEEIVEENIIMEIPHYIKLLNDIKNKKTDKEKAMNLAQSIREFLKVINKLDKNISNIEALRLSKNKLFSKILNDVEKIEFARSKSKINYIETIKELKIEFKKELKKLEI